MTQSANKLHDLLGIEGMTETDMYEQIVFDSVCAGICMNPGCNFTAEYEADQDKGWCEDCNTGTVRSGALLLGVI